MVAEHDRAKPAPSQGSEDGSIGGVGYTGEDAENHPGEGIARADGNYPEAEGERAPGHEDPRDYSERVGEPPAAESDDDGVNREIEGLAGAFDANWDRIGGLAVMEDRGVPITGRRFPIDEENMIVSAQARIQRRAAQAGDCWPVRAEVEGSACVRVPHVAHGIVGVSHAPRGGEREHDQ